MNIATRQHSEAMLYIHIPYCVVKCPYCEFNSYSISSPNNKHSFDENRYTAALIKELEHFCNRDSWNNFDIRSIFFGGGTPSLFSAQSIEEVIRAAKKQLNVSENAEITLEANPGTIQEPMDQDKLKGYAQAGINRISMGGQSFIQAKLEKLGRIHKAGDVAKAIENIKASGIDNYNIDLIFGVAGDTARSWQDEIKEAVRLKPKHISAYSLTLEPGTPFYKNALVGNSMAVDEELSADLFELTIKDLREAGYNQYELSNYSLPNFECSHNLGYWEGLSYLGLGAGAHSFLAPTEELPGFFGSRWSNTPAPLRYMQSIETQGHAIQTEEKLSIKEAHNEFFYLSLRTTKGFSEKDYELKTKRQFSTKVRESIEFLQEKDLLLCKEQEIFVLSDKGRLLVNSIIEELVES